MQPRKARVKEDSQELIDNISIRFRANLANQEYNFELLDKILLAENLRKRINKQMSLAELYTLYAESVHVFVKNHVTMSRHLFANISEDELINSLLKQSPTHVHYNEWTHYHDQLALYVKLNILAGKNIELQILALERWSFILKIFIQQHDYNSAVAIYFSIASNSVIAGLINFLSLPAQLQFKRLDHSLSTNSHFHLLLNEMERNLNHPVVPFIAIYSHIAQMREEKINIFNTDEALQQILLNRQTYLAESFTSAWTNLSPKSQQIAVMIALSDTIKKQAVRTHLPQIQVNPLYLERANDTIEFFYNLFIMQKNVIDSIRSPLGMPVPFLNYTTDTLHQSALTLAKQNHAAFDFSAELSSQIQKNIRFKVMAKLPIIQLEDYSKIAIKKLCKQLLKMLFQALESDLYFATKLATELKDLKKDTIMVLNKVTDLIDTLKNQYLESLSVNPSMVNFSETYIKSMIAALIIQLFKKIPHEVKRKLPHFDLMKPSEKILTDDLVAYLSKSISNSPNKNELKNINNAASQFENIQDKYHFLEKFSTMKTTSFFIRESVSLSPESDRSNKVRNRSCSFEQNDKKKKTLSTSKITDIGRKTINLSEILNVNSAYRTSSASPHAGKKEGGSLTPTVISTTNRPQFNLQLKEKKIGAGNRTPRQQSPTDPLRVTTKRSIIRSEEIQTKIDVFESPPLSPHSIHSTSPHDTSSPKTPTFFSGDKNTFEQHRQYFQKISSTKELVSPRQATSTSPLNKTPIAAALGNHETPIERDKSPHILDTSRKINCLGSQTLPSTFFSPHKKNDLLISSDNLSRLNETEAKTKVQSPPVFAKETSLLSRLSAVNLFSRGRKQRSSKNLSDNASDLVEHALLEDNHEFTGSSPKSSKVASSLSIAVETDEQLFLSTTTEPEKKRNTKLYPRSLSFHSKDIIDKSNLKKSNGEDKRSSRSKISQSLTQMRSNN